MVLEFLSFDYFFFFFSSRRRHTGCGRDWSSDVCSSDLDLEIRSGAGFSNQGSLSLTGGGVLHLRNVLATADLGVITNPSGTVFIDNALTNTASTLVTGSAGIGDRKSVV